MKDSFACKITPAGKELVYLFKQIITKMYNNFLRDHFTCHISINILTVINLVEMICNKNVSCRRDSHQTDTTSDGRQAYDSYQQTKILARIKIKI